MNEVLFEQLLHEGESSSLDYKRDQYPFVGATDDDKSELLKDILAFANGWRHAEGYILIGVDEIAGGRSTVVGVSNHIAENDLQQFVNSKTNRPVTFSYRAYPFESKQIGIITVPQQERPIYLTKNFGKLPKQVVYYRQGTSTAIATPDDIARMGTGQSVAAKQASLVVEFGDTEQELSLGSQINLSAELCRMPESKDIPTMKERNSYGGLTLPHAAFGSYQPNDRYYHDLAEYEFCKRFFRKVRLVVSNTGDVAASDVRIEMSMPSKQGVVIMRPSKVPKKPKRKESSFGLVRADLDQLRPVFRHPGYVDIEENQKCYKLEVDCGKLQPGRSVWSDEFYLGITSSGKFNLTGSLLAANLAGPKEVTLTIEADVRETVMTVAELVSLKKPDGEED